MVEREPLDERRLLQVISDDDWERRRTVVAWIEANLPLYLVATGPDLHPSVEEAVRRCAREDPSTTCGAHAAALPV